MRVRGKLTTPRVVAVSAVLFSSRSNTGKQNRRHRIGLNVVDTRWVTSGASLCVERKKLTAGLTLTEHARVGEGEGLVLSWVWLL